jgi:hypothetical protein
VRRFPYGIFFEVQEHGDCCFHGRCNPRHWQSR